MKMSTGKENEQSSGVNILGTPNRTPLSDVGNNKPQSVTPVFLKRAQYSQVTPFSTPLSHTPKRPVSRISSVPRCLTETGDVPLNSLIYKKVLGIISEKEQEHKNVLEEKDSVITHLQQQLQLLTLPQINITHEEDHCVTRDVVGSPLFPSLGDTSCESNILSSNPDNLNITGLKQISSTYPLSLDDGNLSFDILPLLDSVGSLELKPFDGTTPELDLSLLTSDSKNIENANPKTLDFKGIPTPKSVQDNSTGMTPCSSESKVIPTSVTDSSQMTEIIVTTNTGVGSSSVHTVDQETGTTLVRTTSTSQNTTPVKTTSQETMVSPLKTFTVGQNTSPRRVHTVMTSTDVVLAVDSETMVTPVKCSSVSLATSPASSLSRETCTTPPPQTQDMAVGTSPFCHSLPRPSEIDFSSMKMRDLSLQLETAAISNTLLRDELSAQLQDKKSIYKKVTDTDSKLKEYEEEKRRLQEEAERRAYHIKMEVSKQVEDLMEQQAVALSQISTLRSDIKQRDDQIKVMKKAHEDRIAILNSELADLRKDLVTAYQQKKHQIEALKSEYTATDYRPHYERARREVTELRTQLDMFTGLKDEIKQAQILQKEAAELINKKAKEVEENRATMHQHLAQHRQWEKQHKEWTEEIAKNLSYTSHSKSELETCRKKIDDLERDLADSLKLREQLQLRLSASEEKEKVHFVEKEGLKVSLELLQSENGKSKETIQAVSAELESVKKDLTVTKNSLTSRNEQLTKASQECERYKRLSDMQRSSLFTLRPLSKKVEELEKELEALRQQHTVEEGILNKQMTEMVAELEFIKEERNLLQSESGETQTKLQKLTDENSNLRSQVSLLQNELESLDSHFQGVSDQKAEEEKAARTGLKSLRDLVIQLRDHLSSCRTSWIEGDEENITEEAESVPVLGNSLQSPPEEKEKSRRSSRKSIICSVMKALSGEVDSPTVDLNTPPISLLDMAQNEQVQDRGESDEWSLKKRVVKEEEEEGGSLRGDLDEVEGVVKAVLGYMKSLTSEVFMVIDSLKNHALEAGATAQEVAELRAERDETVRQLQIARTTEADLRESLLGQARTPLQEGGQRQMVDLEKVVAEKNKKIRTLEAMYEKALSHFRATGKITMEDIGVAKENLTLTMEVTELRETSIKQEALISRYSNQKKKLQFNWQTAEEELKKLEQLVETVQQVLCEHESEIRASWGEARRLERLGMFDSTDDTTKLLQYNPQSKCESMPRV